MAVILAIALGGACGSLVRYAIAQHFNNEFLWGTLLVNVVGAVVIGCLFAVTRHPSTSLSPEAQGLLMIGFCGSLTTFSSFSLESLKLIQDGQLAMALAHSACHLLGSLAAVALAFYGTQLLLGALKI